MGMPVQEQDSRSTALPAEKNRPISVLAVDVHPLIRMGVYTLLAAESGLRIVGEASGCAEAWGMLLKLRPDVILVDLMLDDGSACDLIQKIQARSITGHVIVYTAHTGEVHVLEALRAGASGYILKGSTPQRLIDAIYAVAGGGSYLDPAVTSQVIGRMGREQERRMPSGRELTEREAMVLGALAQGKRNKDIAGELFIAESTVRYHIKRLFTKLRVKNRTQAVQAAIKQGLIDF